MVNLENSDKKFWSLAPDKVIEEMDSSRRGLSEEEVKARLKEFGKNILPKGRTITKLSIFINQLKNPLIIILIIAGIVTLLLKDYKDSGFIFFAVLVNTALGFYQENKAENAIKKLQSYIKQVVRVIRGSDEKEISSEGVVPGDLIRLIPGTKITADARLIQSKDLSVDEAVLTGESLPVEKSVDPVEESAIISDRTSMVFAGTLVADGVGLAVVTSTGGGTELGKIAEMVTTATTEDTPLQKAIKGFSKKAGLILIVVTAGLFGLGIYSGIELVDMLIISVAVAVSAVPEGLPVALTVVLSIGVLRLANKKGIVRKLSAAETLGSTTIIMTDKTGTLTEAKMSLSEVISDYSKKELLELALMNTDVIIEKPSKDKDEWRFIGRPLEVGLARAAVNEGVLLEEVKERLEILDIRPFNSSKKYGATYIDDGKEKYWNYLGAPDILIEDVDMPEKKKKEILSKLEEMAYAGKRVLAVVKGDEFLGLLAFSDPVRKGVKDAVLMIKKAGVRTIVITGDHKGTAIAISRESGIEVDGDEDVLTGEEVGKMTDEELLEKLSVVKVFARVLPQDKLRIARLFHGQGEVVAMTGDGVNDSPALREADIGIAVGSGTDVAKGASDLVILDDNFRTIVTAIEEGRRILDNIKKVITYLFTSVVDELVLIGGALLFGLALPLNALQILWVNFILDSFPALALAFEDGFDHLKEKPKKLDGHLFDPVMKVIILAVGIVSSLALMGIYMWMLNSGFDEEMTKTFIFASFSLYSLFMIFSMKSLKENIWQYNPFSNMYLNVSVVFGFVLTLIAIYLPFLQGILGTVSLPLTWMLWVFAFGVANILAIEIVKFVFHRSKR